MGLQKHVYQQIVHAVAPVRDLLIARRNPGTQLHAVQRALARQRFRARLRLTGQGAL
jgi:hypothetical protein